MQERDSPLPPGGPISQQIWQLLMLGSNYRCLWEAKVSKLQAAWCNQQQHCYQRLLGGWEAFGHFVGRDECWSGGTAWYRTKKTVEFLGSFNSYAAHFQHLKHSKVTWCIPKNLSMFWWSMKRQNHSSLSLDSSWPWYGPKVPGSSSSPGSAEPKSLAGHCSAQKAELLGVQRVKRSSHGDVDSVTGSLSKISIHQGTGIYIYTIYIILYIYIYIWVNYNDLTATEPWDHGQ